MTDTKYYYDIKPDTDEWWWQPLPQWVTDTLTHQRISEICNMADDSLIYLHNLLTKIDFNDMSQEHSAILWVAQGEAWRRGFEASNVRIKRVVKR